MEKVTRITHQIKWKTKAGFELLDYNSFKTILNELISKIGETKLKKCYRFNSDFWKGDHNTQSICSCLRDENLVTFHTAHNYDNIVFVTVKDEAKIRKLLKQLD